MVKHDITIGGHFSFGNRSDHAFRHWGRIGVTDQIKPRTYAAFRPERETAADVGTFVLDTTVMTTANRADSACVRPGNCQVLSAGADIILATWAAKGSTAVLLSLRLMSEDEGGMSDVGSRHVESRSWQHTALRGSGFLDDDPEELKAGQRDDSLSLTIRPPVLPLATRGQTGRYPDLYVSVHVRVRYNGSGEDTWAQSGLRVRYSNCGIHDEDRLHIRSIHLDHW